jgi:hypothetical protein
MFGIRLVAGIAVVVALTGSNALAFERVPFEDADVVARAELIVVGAVKVDTVALVEDPGRGPHQTRFTLVVREVIKGKLDEKELTVAMMYGLNLRRDDQRFPRPTDSPVAMPEGGERLALCDTGNSSLQWEPVIEDVRQDCVWLLRRGLDRTRPADDTFGIRDPEDVRPMRFRKYLECYLADDPEPPVRAQLQEQPEIAGRAMRYLAHREIGRILSEPDAVRRVERLLPYYQSRQTWAGRAEAREGLINAGGVAGPYLEPLFDNPTDGFDEDVVRIWGKIRYRAAVPRLIEVLHTQDRFWAKQDLKPGWWNQDTTSKLTQMRREAYGAVCYSVIALGEIGDPAAREAIQLTWDRWAAINFENNQIIEACDQALKALRKEP